MADTLKSRDSTDAKQHHNTSGIIRWMYPLRCTWGDLHGFGPKLALDLVQINLSRTIRFKVRTVYEIGMRYGHLKRERVLHEDRTEIAPTEKVNLV